MAKGTVIEPSYIRRLSSALKRRLQGAQIEHEHVRRDRYRIVVVWAGFHAMRHPQRQRRVWDIAEGTLNKADLLKVAMIVTLSTQEISD